MWRCLRLDRGGLAMELYADGDVVEAGTMAGSLLVVVDGGGLQGGSRWTERRGQADDIDGEARVGVVQ